MMMEDILSLVMAFFVMLFIVGLFGVLTWDLIQKKAPDTAKIIVERFKKMIKKKEKEEDDKDGKRYF